MQQFRGTPVSAGHWSKHGKSGEDGQRHDKGKVLARLNTYKTAFLPADVTDLTSL